MQNNIMKYKVNKEYAVYSKRNMVQGRYMGKRGIFRRHAFNVRVDWYDEGRFVYTTYQIRFIREKNIFNIEK